jgi:hypothetical protein
MTQLLYNAAGKQYARVDLWQKAVKIKLDQIIQRGGVRDDDQSLRTPVERNLRRVSTSFAKSFSS